MTGRRERAVFSVMGDGKRCPCDVPVWRSGELRAYIGQKEEPDDRFFFLSILRFFNGVSADVAVERTVGRTGAEILSFFFHAEGVEGGRTEDTLVLHIV